LLIIHMEEARGSQVKVIRILFLHGASQRRATRRAIIRRPINL
jgi:hypothetical protein